METKGSLSLDSRKIQVLFIGAGPIGLFTAIQIQLYFPDYEIIMFEKYQDYKRKHAVHVGKNSFKGSHPDQKFQSLVQTLHGTIRTNVMEEKLREFAINLGIKIVYQHVTDVRDLVSRYPKCKYLIGSDGSHSIVHAQIFNGKYQLKYNFRSIMEVKYDVIGSTQKLGICSSMSTGSRHLVHQFIGKQLEESKTTPVALRFLITDDEYEILKSATFKHPWSLTDCRIPKDVQTSISSWIESRKQGLDEDIVAGSERLTVVNLPTYASAQFYKRNKDITTFLVGDAACGVPYFRSINNGLLCASVLASHLGDPEVYEAFVQSRVKRELLGAKIKDKAITAMDYSHSSLVMSSDLIRSSNNDDDLTESTTYSFVSLCSIL